MRLILQQYLASLREREELDAILPDLLSELGLNVFSRPKRGTRQDGVDVAAVGSLGGGAERVYLFSIKSGDLGRGDWDGSSTQALRPSLNEILDVYIRNRLPAEHKAKHKVICICVGGEVLETVRPSLRAFIDDNTRDDVSFEEWNGDKMASLIESSLLNENLLPPNARADLRKCLALLEEPDASHRHFSKLLQSLVGVGELTLSRRTTALRQMAVCVWVVFSWARDAGNLEAAYLSAESAMLRAWGVVRAVDEDGGSRDAMMEAFASVFRAYQDASIEFLNACVFPYVATLHGLSSAVGSSSSLDINLKLFDLLGRVSLQGLWAMWLASRLLAEKDEAGAAVALESGRATAAAVGHMVVSNPALLLPVMDNQAIDVSIAALLLLTAGHTGTLQSWLKEMMGRASLTLATHGRYPCILTSYSDLIDHPKRGDEQYRREVTAGSILYPLIAVWAALLDDSELYAAVAEIKREELEHCNFQLWYPDESSERYIYTGDDNHGAELSNVWVDRPEGELLRQVFGECENQPYFSELSAVKFGWWPIVVMACRHSRMPLPLQFFENLWSEPSADAERANP